MDIPQELRFTKEHEWALLDTEEKITIGISDFAQQSLGDITYIELPDEGAAVSKNEAFGVVESVKAVSDLYSPVTGTVVEVNTPLLESPELVNEDPYHDGWLVKIKADDPKGQLEDLMNSDSYRSYVEEKS